MPGGDRQFGIDGRGVGMNQLGPARIPQPQLRSASTAETALRLALFSVDHRAVASDGVAALHLQRGEIRAQIDGKAPSACSFTADAAITAVERQVRRCLNRKGDRLAMA